MHTHKQVGGINTHTHTDQHMVLLEAGRSINHHSAAGGAGRRNVVPVRTLSLGLDWDQVRLGVAAVSHGFSVCYLTPTHHPPFSLSLSLPLGVCSAAHHSLPSELSHALPVRLKGQNKSPN